MAGFRRNFLAVITVMISVLLLLSCTTTHDQSSNFWTKRYNSTLEGYPEYQPLSSNVIEEILQSGDYLFIPYKIDYKPGEKDIYDLGFVADSSGPVLFSNGEVLHYEVIMKYGSGNMFQTYVLLTINPNNFSEIRASAPDFDGSSIEKHVQNYQKKNPGFSRVELYYLADSLRLNGTGLYECIGKDIPIYVYEKFYRSPGSSGNVVESFLIVAKNHSLIDELLVPDALYPEGYHYATGYSRDGFDKAGYDAEGYGCHGFSKDGVDRDGNIYTGQLTSTGMNGFGTLSWTNGDAYRGWFRNNEIDGMGVLYGADGSRYTGEFDFGRKIGFGVHSDSAGTSLLEWNEGIARTVSRNIGEILGLSGDWVFLGSGSRNGKAHGSGSAFAMNSGWLITDGQFIDGRLVSGNLSASDGTIYRGDFSDGLLVDGEIISSNGSVYKGHLSGGKPQGAGFIMNVDGTRYEGEFSNSRYEGEGILTLANGDVFEGFFREGLPHGLGIYKNNSEDTVERCEYYDGKRIDQVYLLRIEQAKVEAGRLAEVDLQMRMEEERQRQELAQEKAAEEARKDAERKKVGGALLAFGGGFFGSQALGLDTASSLRLATALTQDVVGNTGGSNLSALQSSLEANQYQMQMDTFDSKYGKTDLSDVGNYVPPSQPTSTGEPQDIPQAQYNPDSDLHGADSRTNAPQIADRENVEATYTTDEFHAVIDTGDIFAAGRPTRESAIESGKSKTQWELRNLVAAAGYRMDSDDITFILDPYEDGEEGKGYGREWFCKAEASVVARRRVE